MSQLNFFETAEPKNVTITEIQDGEYIYIESFFNVSESATYFKSLRDNIEWKQESMFLYGKEINFPRLTAWYGDNDKPYSFSGITLIPKIWNKELSTIKEKIETVSHNKFNSVLLNLYRDGKDSISWHTDAEKELGENPVIASVNFGEERKFQLKHKHTKERIDIILKNGSLLIMQGTLQHFWKHQVPKTKKEIGERINLTFRLIK